MFSDFINQLIQSVQSTLKAFAEILPQIGFQDIAKKGISLEGSTLENPGILINIGVMGPLKGAILIGMSIDNAHQFASKMMMGMPVETLDEMSKSALSELGNMIMGNAATLLSNDGVSIDITPPSLMVGENISLSSGSMRTISIPLMSEGDEITVDVSFKE